MKPPPTRFVRPRTEDGRPSPFGTEDIYVRGARFARIQGDGREGDTRNVAEEEDNEAELDNDELNKRTYGGVKIPSLLFHGDDVDGKDNSPTSSVSPFSLLVQLPFDSSH